MQLQAMARVVKLPLDKLERLAVDTPVFAPGVANFASMGAIQAVWDEDSDVGRQVEQALAMRTNGDDERARLGAERGGRTKAAMIIERIVAEAQRG